MANLNGQTLTLEEKQAQQKKACIVQGEFLYHYRLISRSVGISEDTLKIWRDNDTEFSEQLEQSRVRFIDKHMKQARPEFLLERLEPEIFKERKEVEANFNEVELSAEQAEQLIRARANRSNP